MHASALRRMLVISRLHDSNYKTITHDLEELIEQSCTRTTYARLCLAYPGTRLV
jgi:hypothetical protein